MLAIVPPQIGFASWKRNTAADARAQQRTGKPEAQQAEGGVDEEREQEDGKDRAQLEGHRHPDEGRQGRHDEERQREVVEQQRVAEVATGVPPVQPPFGEEVVLEPGERGVVARRVPARRHGGQQEKARPQVVEEDEEDGEEAQGVAEPLPDARLTIRERKCTRSFPIEVRGAAC